LPLFGICLGHQVIALANGISTYKMHNGHRGINHPVKNLETGKGEITSQNHGFAVNREEAEAHPDIEITHVHLNDHTVAGLKMKSKNCFSVQYHPEASPGPHDSWYLFDQFIQNIKQHKETSCKV
jgi:carbamoyl-phosphate synthase small subunit